ncbi:MAG TPA: DUF2306 domain-containing protein [Terriglobales bacterium]|jgi:uncharacterized membrane protein
MRATAGSFKKTVFWVVFGLMALVAFLFTSIPMMSPAHPLHSLLYSQRWLLFPHIAAGLVALVIGPMQFSSRLRQRNIVRHRLLGKTYLGSVLVAGVLAPVLAWHYPAFFRYSATTQASVWILCTVTAVIAARRGKIEQHRRWMARGYAVGPVVFVMSRALSHLPGLDHLGIEAGSYSVIVYVIVSIVFADLITDWREIAAGRVVRLGKVVSVETVG